MECPCCFDDMYLLGEQWVCDNCDAHVLPEALEGIHYFPTTGVVHYKDGLKCRRYIDVRVTTTTITIS